MNDLHTPTTDTGGDSIWMRILSAVVLLVLFALAETALWIMAIIQILWRALNGEANARIAEFGQTVSVWTGHAVKYLTGASEARPFPWDETKD